MSLDRQSEYADLLAELFNGNVEAISFCLKLNSLSQVIDDLLDRDHEVNDLAIFGAFHTALFELHENVFYINNINKLAPVMKSAYIAWFDSYRLENENTCQEDRQFSYVLRDQLVDVIIACTQIIRGLPYTMDKTLTIRRFWTHQESYEQYLKELGE